QESREHKKDVDPHPAEIECFRQEMKEHYRERRKAAHRIEFRNSRWLLVLVLFRRRAWWVPESRAVGRFDGSRLLSHAFMLLPEVGSRQNEPRSFAVFDDEVPNRQLTSLPEPSGWLGVRRGRRDQAAEEVRSYPHGRRRL